MIINKDVSIEKLNIEFEIMTRNNKIICVYISNSAKKAKRKYSHLILLTKFIQNCIHDSSIMELKSHENNFL